MRWLAGLLMFVLLSGGVNAQSAEPVLTLGRGEIVSAAWAPDGESVWIGTTAGTWQLDTDLREIAAYPYITYAALSPDGAHIAGISAEGMSTVWDVATGEEVWRSVRYTVSPPKPPVWSPDSIHFVLDTGNGTILYSLNSSPGFAVTFHPARYIAWSESGAYIAAYDPVLQTIQVVDQTGNFIVLENRDRLSDLSWSGRTYLLWRGDSELDYSTVGDGSEARRWSIPDGRLLENVRFSNCWGYGGCSYNPDGNRAAISPAEDAIMRIIDLETHSLLFEFEPQNGYPTDPVWRSDGRRLAIVIKTWRFGGENGVAVLDSADGSIVWERETSLAASQLLWSPDGRQIFTYDAGGRMLLIDGETGDIIAQRDISYSMRLAAVNSDGTRVAAADSGGSIRIYDIASARLTDTWLRTGETVTLLKWQPENNALAVGDWQPYPDTVDVTLWNVQERTRTILPDTQIDGRSNSGTPNITFHRNRGQINVDLYGYYYTQYWINASASVTAGIDDKGNGLLWETQTLRPLQFLANVADLRWTTDNSFLAVLQRDGSLWIQDTDGLRLLWSPVVPVRDAGNVVWSGDGSTLALVQDGIARVWQP